MNRQTVESHEPARRGKLRPRGGWRVSRPRSGRIQVQQQLDPPEGCCGVPHLSPASGQQAGRKRSGAREETRKEASGTA